jgi:hypothetical protein
MPGGGRRNDYIAPKPPADTSQRLAEALLGAEINKTRAVLTTKFDQPRDSDVAHQMLRAIRDGYTPPRS